MSWAKMTPSSGDPLAGAGALPNLGAWLAFAAQLYGREGLALGQVATNAHDEALYLFLRTLGLPLDSDSSVLERELTPQERSKLKSALRRRVVGRIPAAYLTREAFLGEHRFYVDERAIIPRSYFLEMIPRLRRLLGRRAPGPLRMADVCTGSGCLAVLLAHAFPGAKVDAIDVSRKALEVARINIREHGLGERVRPFKSDVFDSVPGARYDLILSNPPYEPSARVDALPAEFRREPRLALDGGADGLAIIRRLLDQAAGRLAPRGIVLIEVGGLRRAMDREFSRLKPEWLPTQDGSDCICLIRASGLAPQRAVRS
jgi:ribosomal protein L3 glutamine methyltransferase